MKKIKIILFILLCILATFKISDGGTRHPSTEDGKHIEYGEGFPFIGQLIIIDSNNQLSYGSAVAYDDDIIITAAHLLGDGEANCFVDINKKNILILKTIKHEEYNEDIFGYNDIAICLCEKPIELKWYPALYEGEDEVNKICCMGGFGLPGTFETGYSKNGDYTRRAGSNKIDGIDKNLLICSPSNTNRTSLEYCISPGDSGGGLFIDNKLAGINSCIMATQRQSKSDYGSESGHTRISKYVNWIKENSKTIKANKNK